MAKPDPRSAAGLIPRTHRSRRRDLVAVFETAMAVSIRSWHRSSLGRVSPRRPVRGHEDCLSSLRVRPLRLSIAVLVVLPLAVLAAGSGTMPTPPPAPLLVKPATVAPIRQPSSVLDGNLLVTWYGNP